MVRVGELPLRVRQIRVADGNDEAPVVADRAALDPGDAEIERLELDAGNPDRREEMALEAAHDHIAAELVAKPPAKQGGAGDGADREQRDAQT